MCAAAIAQTLHLYIEIFIDVIEEINGDKRLSTNTQKMSNNKKRKRRMKNENRECDQQRRWPIYDCDHVSLAHDSIVTLN